MPRDRGVRVERTLHTEGTLVKVYFGLAAAGITGQQATDAVNEMQNQGILFREGDTQLVQEILDELNELTEAIRLTVEYTGNDILPAVEGWSWFDALKKYAPGKAQVFVDNPIHFPKKDQDNAEESR